MSHPIKRLCDRLARQLSSASGGASIAGAVVDLGGQKAFGFSMAEASTGDMVMMAVALLRSVEEATAGSALACEGCAADFDRVTAALKALKVEKPRPAAAHLH